ncbi:MAG: carboxypeptidase regulatory-like domain-containing protein, partial [Caldilineaceae bacterium]|nr:carboxypeptidase regulatory-like domain-containing protein [Caldilineaceae bacterium]
TTTDADGNYTVNATGVGPYRIEFTLPGELVDFMRPGAAGATTVQFVADGGATNVDVGFNNPGQYAPDENLPIAIAEHTSGYRQFIDPIVNDPTITTIFENYGSDETFANALAYSQPPKGELTYQDDTGAIWAMAYDRSNEVLYAGSFIRRFVPLKGNPTTIHRVDVSTGNVTDWITLDPTRIDPHGATPDWMEDFDVISSVGKEGIGGIKMSEDGSTVYAVDLGTRTLYSIPVNADGSAGTPTTIDLVNGVGSPYSLVNNCTVDSDFRPFGLGVRDGVLYVGAVCSGESTANNTGLPTTFIGGARVGDPSALSAYIFAFNGTDWSLPVTYPLNYERGMINRQGGNAWAFDNAMNNAQWATWVYTYPFTDDTPNNDNSHYPQPIVSEIEFDNNGDMIIGMMDRFSLMDAAMAARPDNGGINSEATAAGDILRACVTTPGNWVMENLISGDTSCDTTGALTHDNPPDTTTPITIDEYYFTDQYHGFENNGASNFPNHSEVAQGALAQIPGREFVISTVQDPNFNATLYFYRSGLHWYNNSDGSFLRAYEVRDEQMRTLGYWAKAGGLGDVEALVPPAPIEIGNRV